MNALQKSLKILNRKEKRTGVLLLFLAVLKGISETAGIASILPFLSVLAKPEFIESNQYASRVYQALGFKSVDSFLFVLGLLVIVTLVVSALVKVLTVYATSKWVAMREFSLSRKLLETYLRQPYSYSLTRNSSRMSALILQESQTVVIGFYHKAINLFGSAASFVFIFSLLIWANPMTTIMSILIIGTSYLILYFCLRGMLKTKGEIMLAANQARFRRVNETFAGIKQVKLSSLENFALTLFSGPSKELAQAKAVTNVASQIPRYGFEVIAFGGIIALTLVISNRSDGALETVLPLLGLYAMPFLTQLRLAIALKN